jgi:hypothetical protein
VEVVEDGKRGTDIEIFSNVNADPKKGERQEPLLSSKER